MKRYYVFLDHRLVSTVAGHADALAFRRSVIMRSCRLSPPLASFNLVDSPGRCVCMSCCQYCSATIREVRRHA